MEIDENIAKEIAALAQQVSIELLESYYEVSVGRVTMYRNFEHKDLLCSIHLHQIGSGKKTNGTGLHYNIFKNGDIFKRSYPYYDGVLDLNPIHNQRAIQKILTPFLEE